MGRFFFPDFFSLKPSGNGRTPRYIRTFEKNPGVSSSSIPTVGSGGKVLFNFWWILSSKVWTSTIMTSFHFSRRNMTCSLTAFWWRLMNFSGHTTSRPHHQKGSLVRLSKYVSSALFSQICFNQFVYPKLIFYQEIFSPWLKCHKTRNICGSFGFSVSLAKSESSASIMANYWGIYSLTLFLGVLGGSYPLVSGWITMVSFRPLRMGLFYDPFQMAPNSTAEIHGGDPNHVSKSWDDLPTRVIPTNSSQAFCLSFLMLTDHSTNWKHMDPKKFPRILLQSSKIHCSLLVVGVRNYWIEVWYCSLDNPYFRIGPLSSKKLSKL